MKNRHHRPAAAYRRMHRIIQQREDRSELSLLRAAFAAVCEFDQNVAQGEDSNGNYEATG